MNQKRILFILKQAPYGSSAARDAIDMILASAAYDQILDILFIDDGVYQLLKDQQPEQQKRIASLLAAFEMYDIENVYFEAQSLLARDIDQASLAISAQAKDSEGVKSLIQQADTVLTF
jgi:tRNA 2-thiouridine synthesizing protein C